MSIESIMTAVGLRSNSFYESYGQSSSDKSKIKFAEQVKSAIAMIDSDFDQELVLYAYLSEGDIIFIRKHITNMVINELPECPGIMSKISRLRRTSNLMVMLKGTSNLFSMIESCGDVALVQAISRKTVSSRDAAKAVGCSKDSYINNYRDIVDTVTNNLRDRLYNAERKIKSVIYE